MNTTDGQDLNNKLKAKINVISNIFHKLQKLNITDNTKTLLQNNSDIKNQEIKSTLKK